MGNCWRRENIKGGDVLSKIVEEVDDKSRRRQQQKTAAAEGRSTGPVDRRAQRAQV